MQGSHNYNNGGVVYNPWAVPKLLGIIAGSGGLGVASIITGIALMHLSTALMAGLVCFGATQAVVIIAIASYKLYKNVSASEWIAQIESPAEVVEKKNWQIFNENSSITRDFTIKSLGEDVIISDQERILIKRKGGDIITMPHPGALVGEVKCYAQVQRQGMHTFYGICFGDNHVQYDHQIHEMASFNGFLLTLDSEGTISLWNPETGKCVSSQTFKDTSGHDVWIDGNDILIGRYQEKELQFTRLRYSEEEFHAIDRFTLPSGAKIFEFRNNKIIYSIYYLNDSDRKTIHFYDLNSQQKKTIKTNFNVSSAFAEDGLFYAIAWDGRSIQILNEEDGSLKGRITTPPKLFRTHIARNGEGLYFATNDDHQCKIYTISS